MDSATSLDPSLARPEAALRFLVGRIDYERMQSMPCAEEAFKLDRMRELLRRLDNPQHGLPIVHVAGTKGKGSTAAMIASALSAAGHRTGLFTSPHLDRVEQRIAVDGRPCSGDELAELVEQVRPAVEALDRAAAESDPPEHGPTYFEIVTALALQHFARRRVDAAVLEVGLGGRLDSTNVCTPLISVITSISFDHTKQLGNTLAAIAAEKAGIIKPGVPVVSGVTPHEPREVIRRIAAKHGCRLIEQGVDFDFRYAPPRHLEQAASPGWMEFRISVAEGRVPCRVPCPRLPWACGGSPQILDVPTASVGMAPGPHPNPLRAPTEGWSGEGTGFALGLLGRHQAANAAVALAALEELRRIGWMIPEAAVRTALANISWPARTI